MLCDTGSAALFESKLLETGLSYFCTLGGDWLQELIKEHPDRIYTELGVRLHVFYAFLLELRILGMEDSKTIRLEESLAIFLYTCVTGLTIDHESSL